MTKGKTTGGEAATREERLAAKLRENLRRRKAQARDIDSTARETTPRFPNRRASANERTPTRPSQSS